MKCPNCANEVQADAVFCDHCGLRLRQPEAAAPTAAAAPVAATPAPVAVAPQPAAGPAEQGSVCAKCGASNMPGEMFCGECGAPLQALKPEAVAAPTPSAASPAQAAPVAANVCPACGAQVAVGDEFCYACGADIGAARQAAAATPAMVAAPAAAPPVAATAPAALPVAASSTPAASAPTAPAGAMSECPTCGGKVNAGDSFCDVCGAALIAPAQTGGDMASPVPANAPVTPQTTATPPVVAPATTPVAAAAPVGAVPAATPVVTSVAPPAPSVFQARPRLVVVASGIEIPLPVGKEALVGREDPYSGIFPEVDLTPHGAEENGVSRRHFKIGYVGGQYVIEDLNSTNSTILNRQRLQPGAPAPLADGDQIRAGRLRLVFKVS